MVGGKLSLWAMVSVAAALSAAGCCQEQEKQIQTLQRESKDAMEQNRDLRNQLTAAQASEVEANRKLEAKDAELVNKDAEMAGLRSRASDANARASAAPGRAGNTVSSATRSSSAAICSLTRARRNSSPAARRGWTRSSGTSRRITVAWSSACTGIRTTRRSRGPGGTTTWNSRRTGH